jgi:hypothetical protein
LWDVNKAVSQSDETCRVTGTDPIHLDDATKAKLDASHVVICVLPSGESIVVRGQHFLNGPDVRNPSPLVMTTMRVSSRNAAGLMQLLLEQRPSPPPPSGWQAGR